MGSRRIKQKVLPNSYVPIIDKKILANVLGRLPKKSLLELANVWPKFESTQPKPHGDWTQSQFNEYVLKKITEMKTNISRIPKKTIIDRILYRYWSEGLNLLQLSQIDCQLIVDRPNAYYWVKSTARDQFGKQVPILVDPKKFLDLLAHELSLLYLTYIYVCRHPLLPLLLIRIQVFDLAFDNASSLKTPHIISNKPYFIAIPLNSPHLIHSPGNNIVTKIVLQVVERCLPQNKDNILQIDPDKDENPVRSLESMHILGGSSRFSHSLGIWTPYADAAIDMLPLNPVETHKMLAVDESENITDEEAEINEQDKEIRRMKKIANIRFKGSVTGTYKSGKFFDDVKLRRSRRLIKDNDTSDYEDHEDDKEQSEFASIAPVQFVDFEIKENINKLKPDELSSIKLTLTGLDVFAGLHELSVAIPDKEKAVIDPSTIPDWLTGQEGAKCGKITNSVFKSSD